MKYRYLSIILILLIVSIGAVSAHENSTSDDIVGVEQDNEVLSASEYVIDDSNYATYFNETSGAILENSNISDGDTIKLGNVNNKDFILDKLLTVTSNSSSDVLTNVSFYFMEGSDDSTISDLNIVNNAAFDEHAVSVIEAANIVISGNIIDVESVENSDTLYAIYAYCADNLNIQANAITYVGKTNGTKFNSAIAAFGSENVSVEGNTLDVSIPSADVDWPSGGQAIASGVKFIDCNGLEFIENTMNLITNVLAGSYPTVYAIEIKGSDDVVVRDNYVSAESSNVNSSYLYALSIQGGNFDISSNEFYVTSDTKYVCGVDVEGASSGVVDNNDILLYSPFVAYGIYACDWNYDGQVVNYTNNHILGNSYAVYGMELFFGQESTIDNNNIVLQGNYTTGITEMMTGGAATIINNDIYVFGTSNDTGDSGDYYSPAMTIGILSLGESQIHNNAIVSTGNWTIQNSGSNVTITDNYLVSSELIGNDSVNDMSGDAIVENNIPITGETNYDLTNDTFFLFFDDYGRLRDNITAESLTFIGEFSDLTSSITIDRPIKLLGDDAILHDMSFEIASDNVIVEDFTFISDSLSEIISIVSFNNVSILGSNFIVQGVDGDNNAVIHFIGSDKSRIELNTINFTVETNGTYENRAIYAEGSHNLVMGCNDVYAYLPSRSIDWGSGTVYSEGVFIKNSDNVVLDDNTIAVRSNDQISDYDTIYALHVTGDNASLVYNRVGAIEAPYGYALVIAGEDFTIFENYLVAGENGTYACGIDVESNSNGLIDSNEIVAIGDSAYGIYTANWAGDVKANITNNIINANGITVFAMSLSGSEALVEGNNISTTGNFTTGIASAVSDIAINDNEIIANGSNVGTPFGHDSMGIQTMGVHIVGGNAVVTNNNITSNSQYAVNMSGNGSVTDNELYAEIVTGDFAVDYVPGQGIIVSNNKPEMDYKLTNETFFIYFDEDGYLKEQVKGDNLTFIGEFSNLVENITINKTIKLLSDNAILNNIALDITSDDVVVDGFNFTGGDSGIFIGDVANVEIINNSFDIVGHADELNVAIEILNSENVTIENNNIVFGVETNGTYENVVVHAEESDNLVMRGNMITASLPARSIDWASGVVYSQGVFLDNCNNAVLEENSIAVRSNDQISTFDTIYALNIKGDNATLTGNNLGAIEAPYGYALVITGENFNMVNNVIFAGENGTYACGIDVESNSNGVIDSNLIVATGESAYGIYTANWAGDVKANITNNVILSNANSPFALSLSGSEALVENNSILAQGNYTTGIASAVGNIVINNNTIIANGSNVGTPSGYDTMGIETTGIHVVSGNAIVTNNKINATNKYAVDFDGKGQVTDNEIYADMLTGDFAVDYVQNGTVLVENNTPEMELDYKLTNDTFYIYFDEEGLIREQIDADNLTFIGEFSNLVDVITINKPIRVLSDNATLNDIAMAVFAGDVVVDGFNFTGKNSGLAIASSDNVQVKNNNFDIEGVDYEGNLVILISESNNVTLENNTIKFGVETNDTFVNVAVYADDCDNLVMKGNNITASLPARSINWTSGVVYSQGVFLDNCDNAVLDANSIGVKSNGQISTYDTIYAVNIKGDNATVSGNILGAVEAPYGYGLVITGENFNITNNMIVACQNGTYACGIDVESNSNGVIDSNFIYAAANESAYAIYTANWAGDVKANITDNVIAVNANSPFALSLSGSEFLVEDNSILAQGNYTTGIASAADDIVINNNTIIANGSNVGTPSGYDTMGIETTGVHIVSGSAKVTDNNVTTTGEFAVDLDGTGQVTENYLVADVYTGDASVDYTPDQRTIVQNNTPAMQRTVISAEDIVMYYKNGTRYVIVLTDQERNPLANKNVTLTINGASYKRITDENGTASLAINLNSGNYTASASYVGESGYSNATCEINITVLSTVFGDDIVKMFKNGTQYYATFLDGQGNPLADGTSVTFNINGVFYTRQVNGSEGKAKLNINLVPGVYIITAINPVNGEMHANNVTVLATMEGNDLVKYYKNESQYVVTVYGADGKVAGAGESVTFNINGVFYTRQTNESGQAKLNINLQPGNYTITAEYKGAKLSNNIEVKPILFANDLVKKYGTSDQFIAYLVDGQGKAYAGQTVNFNIHGRYYERVTDTDGRAILNIKLSAAANVYYITSSYNGYSITNTITVTP